MELRAVGYARVSTEEQVKGYGIAYTAKGIEKHNARKGWRHLETFRDEGLSGTLSWQERPGAKRLMALAQQTPRPFDVVTVYETRAIGRKDRTFYRWWWKLEDLGIAVAVVDKDIDTTTEEGRQRLRDEANDAFKEIAKIRKRTQNGVQEKAEEGGHVGGVAPFGYRIEDQGRRGLSRLVLDETAVETLRMAWGLIVTDRNSCAKTAQELNSRNRPGFAGRSWDSQSVRHALTKDVIQRGKRCFRSTKSRMANLAAIDIPLDPIFTELEIAQLNAALARTARPTNRPASSYMLSRHIIGFCGAHYTGVRHSDGRKVYVCTGSGCGCSQVDASTIEREVWTEVNGLILDPDRLRAASETWSALERTIPEDHLHRIATFDREIEELEASIDAMAPTAALQAARRGLRGREAQDAVARSLKPLTDRLADAQRLRREASAWHEDAAEVALRRRELEALAGFAARRMDSLSEDERSDVLDFLKLRVQILGPVPRKVRRDDGVSAWFRERNRAVPSLTDEAWELVRPIFEARHAGRKATDPRGMLNAVLYKARTGCAWRAIPDGRGYVALAAWQRWTRSGRWDELMEALASMPGVTPPRDGVTLPPLVVYGEVHPDLWIDGDNQDGSDDLLRSSQPPSISFRIDLAA